jgi:small subunit ribosomal protein S2
MNEKGVEAKPIEKGENMSISIRDLLEAGVHFGHKTSRWNPKMRPYIYGSRNGIHIIDLQKTVRLFRYAYNVVRDNVAQGQSVLFVGTKRQAQEIVSEEATRCGQFFIQNRWLGGTLTNFRTIKQSVERLNKLEEMFEDGSVQSLPKKEALQLEKQCEKLKRNLGGIQKMKNLPGLIFVIDPVRDRIAVSEARKLGVPVIAVVDTNSDPTVIDLPIPGNDDALRSIRLISQIVAEACIEGKALQKKELQEQKGDRKPSKSQKNQRFSQQKREAGGPPVVIRSSTPRGDEPNPES